ncbi:septum formation inhibitor Maf [Psychromonas sp. RZ22]|uniref:Maf family protein n=1 Tax=Psychromonas algarum TaxID=2555643 RepID=UPI001067B2F8|nr:nucleoside triphosphate pyrophosphatase [Psychromonas sp. RZ22]TEW54369.1 septum formation inhibitor Maf [Psychromonas sp. RZ22]
MPQKLVLASTSPFRKQLLEKLHLDFSTANPQVNEEELPGETAIQLVERLAIAKAQAVVNDFPDSLIIGSDQVCLNNGKILGKPGNFENAFKQLKAASAQHVTFYTGLAVVNSKTGKVQSLVEPYDVYFRELSDEMITNYLNKEEPYNCAGSFKSEGFGISLFSQFDGKDPNSLIGLPLISLIKLLENEGFSIL